VQILELSVVGFPDDFLSRLNVRRHFVGQGLLRRGEDFVFTYILAMTELFFAMYLVFRNYPALRGTGVASSW
jgi:hypothetical protein